MSPRSRPSWLSRRRAGVALALILLFGGGLRLSYALPDLHQGRFWDERYSFENVESILETWSFEPARGYYPAPIQSWPQALAVGASQWLAETLGVESLRTVNERGRFTSTAFLLVRLLSVVYGTASLALLFAIGRRMFSPAVGLLASLSLAATPWHVHLSSKFKPDALLVLTVLLAFYWALGAIESGRWRDYALAGFGIALAASAKLLGVLVAVPVTVGSVWLAVRERSRVGRLAFAAAVSLVAFTLLNPFGWNYLWYVDSLQDDYAMRAGWRGMTRGGMPAQLGEYLFSASVHGPLLASLAVVGLLALAVNVLRSSDLLLERRAERSMLVVFPPFYAVAYLAATPYFKGNNLAPIVPFTTLAAIWLLRSCWGGVAERLRLAPWTSGMAAALLAALLVWPGPVYVHRSLTPTTFDLALRFLQRGVGSASGRIFVIEEVELGTPRWEKREPLARNSALVHVDRLEEATPARLRAADGEMFHESRLRGPNAAFYHRRLERLPEERVARFEPRGLALRGPALVAIRHWRRAGTGWIELTTERCPGTEHFCASARMPGQIAASELVSLSVRLRGALLAGAEPPSTIGVGAQVLPLRRALGSARARAFLTERFALQERGARVRLETPGLSAELGEGVSLAVRQWGPRRSRAVSPSPPAEE